VGAARRKRSRSDAPTCQRHSTAGYTASQSDQPGAGVGDCGVLLRMLRFHAARLSPRRNQPADHHHEGAELPASGQVGGIGVSGQHLERGRRLAEQVVEHPVSPVIGWSSQPDPVGASAELAAQREDALQRVDPGGVTGVARAASSTAQIAKEGGAHVHCESAVRNAAPRPAVRSLGCVRSSVGRCAAVRGSESERSK
jgi:hypothetical protein